MDLTYSVPSAPLASGGRVDDSNCATPDREIDIRLDRIDHGLNELAAAVDVLGDRLGPVMTPSIKSASGEKDATTAVTALGRRIEAQEIYLRNACDRISDLLARLEI